MPSGLKIKSAVDCSFLHTVRTAGSRHEVRAENRTLNTYLVSIEATCDPEICFIKPSGDSLEWNHEMLVPRRPGRGGKGHRAHGYGLRSLTTSSGATVTVRLGAMPTGFVQSVTDTPRATETIRVQVKTE
jgi:hypothetical protein